MKHVVRTFYCAALNAGRSSQEKAVRLSVRPSVYLSVCQTCALQQNGRNICSDLLYHRKDHLA